MEDPEQMGYIHLDRFLPVMSRLVTPHSSQLKQLENLKTKKDHPAREVSAGCPWGSFGCIPGAIQLRADLFDHHRPSMLTTLVTLTRSCSPRSSRKRARLSQRWTNVFFPHRCFSSQEEMQEFCNAALDPVTKSVHYKEFVHFLSVDDNF